MQSKYTIFLLCLLLLVAMVSGCYIDRDNSGDVTKAYVEKGLRM